MARRPGEPLRPAGLRYEAQPAAAAETGYGFLAGAGILA